MSSNIYDSLFRDAFAGAIVVGTDVFYMMLVTSSYTPAKTHTKRSDITNEVVGAGYTAGGAVVALSGALPGSDRYDLTVGAVSWATATIAAAGAVVYKHRGGASSADELVAYLDFGGTITSTGGTFAVTPSSPVRVQN